MGENQDGCACAQRKDLLLLLKELRNVEDPRDMFRLLVKCLSVHSEFVFVGRLVSSVPWNDRDGNLM